MKRLIRTMVGLWRWVDMKKLVVLIVFFSMALGFNLTQINETRAALVGALNEVLGNNTGSVQYIPGYGLTILSRGLLSEKKAPEIISSVKPLLVALVPMIKGLDDDDWVSIGYKTDDYEIIIRIKPTKANSLEVWLDGKKQ